MIALVGAPNSGKTTLFNWLTGSRFRAVNYAGSTVEIYLGKTVPSMGEPLSLMDTPGIYSLLSNSPDEQVTYRALIDSSSPNVIQHVIFVVDGTQLERQLAAALQVKALGIPMTIALTMSDLLNRDGVRIDLAQLGAVFGGAVVAIDGLSGQGIHELVKALRLDQRKRLSAPVALSDELATQDLHRSHQIAGQVRTGGSANGTSVSMSRKFDRYLLHPFWGLVSFLLIMSGLFSSIFWLAAPAMDLIDSGFTLLIQWVSDFGAGSLLSDFLGDGIIASFAAVLVFVPQIFILFFGLSFLEDSGYLARAAAIVDRPLSKLGLSGRSFVPMLSGFACAVPAMMATRNIRSSSERWIALAIIPLMTCSARIPVYALLLSFLFVGKPSWQPGVSLAGIYILSLLVGLLAAGILSRLTKTDKAGSLLMELPLYRRPRLKVIARTAFMRTASYVKKAGPVIFVLAIFVWAGTHFPRIENADPSTQLVESYAGKIGHAVEPLFAPLGVDWRVGVGLISAFAAREVFVSAMALTFRVSADLDDSSLQKALIHEMSAAQFPDGRLIFTPASITALIIFFMIALQCLSTTGIAMGETRSKKFAIGQLIGLNLIAYFLAAIAYQIVSALG